MNFEKWKKFGKEIGEGGCSFGIKNKIGKGIKVRKNICNILRKLV